MKFIDEYRNEKAALLISARIKKAVVNPCNIMEICGGQTHTILKYNLEQYLPDEITMIHGPGCPVCVTPVNFINAAIEFASNNENIIASYGDMLRVPGTVTDLLSVKAEYGDIRMVYSPLEAVKIAKENPDRKIIFFVVGFETTAPANASAILEAEKLNLRNFFVICSQMLVPPALEAILSNEQVKINGLLAAGHVCTIMGYEEYNLLSEKYSIPIVATGFEPLDLLSGILMIAEQLRDKRHVVENQYSRVVSQSGNMHAQEIIRRVFEPEDREWRGIGVIPKSGLKLNEKYKRFDAMMHFNYKNDIPEVDNHCIAGEILQGFRKPHECELFGVSCNPEHPFGAPMVSSEGACAAYFRYRNFKG